jgi:hypothetical protein
VHRIRDIVVHRIRDIVVHRIRDIVVHRIRDIVVQQTEGVGRSVSSILFTMEYIILCMGEHRESRLDYISMKYQKTALF